MRPLDTRAVYRIAFALVWSSCLPLVSAACDQFDMNCIDDGMELSQQTIGIIAGCAALLFLLALVAFYLLRRRRLQRLARATQLSRIPYDGTRKPTWEPPPPSYAPAPSGYPVYYQGVPPAPPPLHMPQYPPHSNDTYQSHSPLQQSPLLNVRAALEPVAPASPGISRAPSSSTARPISSIDTTPPVITMPSPSIPPMPASPRSTRRDVVPPPLPSSPPPSSPRSPPTVVPSLVSPPSQRPSGTTLSPKARPIVLAPMNTGTSNRTGSEAPPAYTPV
ncbi:hypothetical protein HD554DRAFT_2126570 [Boletus coccyginus]|nr:hypothetical protein HD554DRAFT_2126570 [Boletus coccyginus]